VGCFVTAYPDCENTAKLRRHDSDKFKREAHRKRNKLFKYAIVSCVTALAFEEVTDTSNIKEP
jgi:hypothetical protein